MKKQAHLKNYLKHIIKSDPDTLRSAVAMEALGYSGEINAFFSDLLSHGCINGMVGSLVYYADTHNFFDRNYYEIEALREELENAFCAPLQPKGDLKNWFAWMAFEETARKIAEELEL